MLHFVYKVWSNMTINDQSNSNNNDFKSALNSTCEDKT